MENRHLISVDELRAAGALDVPPAWRKSLGAERVERDLFSDLIDDDEPGTSEQDGSRCDEDEDEDEEAIDELP